MLPMRKIRTLRLDDAAVLAEMERQAKLDTEEAKLRARLAEIAEERKGGETK